jgi:hypothetical protein
VGPIVIVVRHAMARAPSISTLSAIVVLFEVLSPILSISSF